MPNREMKIPIPIAYKNENLQIAFFTFRLFAQFLQAALRALFQKKIEDFKVKIVGRG